MVQGDITVVSHGKSTVWSKNKKAVADLRLDWGLWGVCRFAENFPGLCIEMCNLQTN
jgi:hypothetical protein